MSLYLGSVPERSKGRVLRSRAYASWVRIPPLPISFINYKTIWTYNSNMEL